MNQKQCGALGLLLALAACSAAPTVPPVPAAPPPGYLSPGALDILAVLPPAPQAGQARYENDRAVFRATRSLRGSARWTMAADDALLGPADMLRHFSCALDMQLQPAAAPKLLRLLQRANRDAGQAMNVAKDHFQRQRPFWIDAGETCRPKAELGDTFDYPSGHTMLGWTWGMVLTQVAPERGAQLLARGRSIGESRVVCGVHNASAVDAGRIAATAVVTLIATQPEYAKDLQAAREEYGELRRSAPRPDAQACAVEAELIAAPVG